MRLLDDASRHEAIARLGIGGHLAGDEQEFAGAHGMTVGRGGGRGRRVGHHQELEVHGRGV
jgi:hypothetical protein